MTAEELLHDLDVVRPRGPGKWSARCPAHPDRSPSLSIREGDDGRLLLHCFAGCTLGEICGALGLPIKDLFKENLSFRRPLQPSSRRFNGYATAFPLQLHALDLRLRAEAVLRTARGMCTQEWSEGDLHEALGVVGQAYANLERADLLDDVCLMIRTRGLVKENQNAPRCRVA